jgi:hypothetical protein
MTQCSASLTGKKVKSLCGKKFGIGFGPNYIYILGYKIYIVLMFHAIPKIICIDMHEILNSLLFCNENILLKMSLMKAFAEQVN